ncbi:hypothetical protein SAFG77S_04582 [Streptomyces afghaniensis]
MRPYSPHQARYRSMSVKSKTSFEVSTFDHQIGMFTTVNPSSRIIPSTGFNWASVQPNVYLCFSYRNWTPLWKKGFPSTIRVILSYVDLDVSTWDTTLPAAAARGRPPTRFSAMPPRAAAPLVARNLRRDQGPVFDFIALPPCQVNFRRIVNDHDRGFDGAPQEPSRRGCRAQRDRADRRWRSPGDQMVTETNDGAHETG